MSRHEELSADADRQLYGVMRSVRYHKAREAWFDSLRTWLQFLTQVLGTTTVVLVLKEYNSKVEAAAAVLVAVLTTADQILRTAKMARLHASLAARFTALERDMVLLTAEELNKRIREFTGRRLEIEADEPPVKRVLDIICDAQLSVATGRARKCPVTITHTQHILRHICDWKLSRILEQQADTTATTP